MAVCGDLNGAHCLSRVLVRVFVHEEGVEDITVALGEWCRDMAGSIKRAAGEEIFGSEVLVCSKLLENRGCIERVGQH